MGSSISKFLGNVFNSFKNKEFKILMLGLDNAGKTTILHKIRFKETIITVPTIGFNLETVSHRNLKLEIWDIGG